MKRFIHKLKNKTEFLQFAAIGNQGFLSIIGLIRTLIVVRLLSPEDYGVIGIATAVGGLFTVFQNMGLGVGVAKEAAQNPDPGRLKLITRLILSVRLAILMPLLIVLVFVAAPESVNFYKIPQIDEYIYLYALFILLSSPGDILGYILTGSGRFKAFFKLKIMNEILLTIIVSYMIFEMGVSGYFIGQSITAFIYTSISYLVIRRYTAGKATDLSRSETKELLRSILRTSLSAFIAKLSRSFSLQAPVLLAGLYLSITEMGWLKFGMQAGGYVATIVSAAQVVTLPKMIDHYKQYGKESLFEKFSTNYFRLTALVSLIVIGAISTAPFALPIIAGAEFISSTKPFQFIVIYYALVISADTIFSGIYFPLNRERLYVKSYLIYFVVSISLTYLSLNYYKTIDSAFYGLVLGAGIHYLLAVMFLYANKSLFYKLLAISLRIALFVTLAYAYMYAVTIFDQAAYLAIWIMLFLWDTLKSEPNFFKLILKRKA